MGIVSKGRRYIVCAHMIRAYAVISQELAKLLYKSAKTYVASLKR